MISYLWEFVILTHAGTVFCLFHSIIETFQTKFMSFSMLCQVELDKSTTHVQKYFNKNMAMSFKQRNHVYLYNRFLYMLIQQKLVYFPFPFSSSNFARDSSKVSIKRQLSISLNLIFWQNFCWYQESPPVSIKIDVTTTSDNCLFFFAHPIVDC